LRQPQVVAAPGSNPGEAIRQSSDTLRLLACHVGVRSDDIV
jgi:hypothetical protein